MRVALSILVWFIMLFYSRFTCTPKLLLYLYNLEPQTLCVWVRSHFWNQCRGSYWALGCVLFTLPATWSSEQKCRTKPAGFSSFKTNSLNSGCENEKPNSKHAFTAYGIAFALSIVQCDDAEMLLVGTGKFYVEKGRQQFISNPTVGASGKEEQKTSSSF